jgi:hypothetical protein
MCAVYVINSRMKYNGIKAASECRVKCERNFLTIKVSEINRGISEKQRQTALAK